MFFALICLSAGKLNAQQFINGNLSTGATHVGTGTTAPAGTAWSELQGGNTGLGSGANITAGFSIADNFTVPAGPSWAVTKVTFFAYSTGFAGAVSPFVDTRVQIFNTDPSVGNPAPIYGDLTTNRFAASSLANIFRTGGATADQTRRVWKIEATVNVVLAPGTYWIEWAHGNGGLSNFTPPSTSTGVPSPAGANSLQRNFSGGLPGTWAAITDAGGPQDQYFIVDYTTGPCAGTPAPGNTIASVATACAGNSFTLSLQNPTLGSGVSYQWQSASAVGGPWTNFGTNASTQTTSLAATTFYRCNVTCAGGPATTASTPVQVNLTPVTSCYCIPVATDCSLDDEILNVTLGTFTNSSSGCSGAGYTNYSALTGATLVSGAPNPISVSVGPGGTETVYVWVDYDKNGVFDASEFSVIGVGNGSTINGSIPVPAGMTGSTRMRVRVRFGATALTGTSACTGGFFGETEDYTVNFTPCVQGVFTSVPVNTTISCSGNASFSVAATGSFLSYSWQYRVNATSPWQTVTNTGVYSGATTPTLLLLNVPQTMSGYQYRALIQGGCTAVDFSTPPATLTVNPLVATVTPTSASICTGSIQQITLTNPTSTPVYGAPSGLPLAITDNSLVGNASTINVFNVPAGAVVTDVSIKFTMPHTWVGDVVMNLKAPNGQVLNLIGLLDGGTGSNSSNDFTNTVISSTGVTALSGAPAPRTGTFKADAFTATIPSSAPTTTNTWAPLLTTLNGAWSLVSCDVAAGDAGTLTAWSITITYNVPPAQGVWTASPAAPNTMFTDAAATVPYVAGAPANSIWVKPTVNTSYSVVYSTPTPCTSAATVVPITVVNPPTAVVNPVNKAVCVGGSTTFTTSATGGPFTYQWQVSTTAVPAFTNITGATAATLTLTGVTQTMNNNQYRAIITAAPCAGSTTTTAATLTVNPLPTITLAAPVTQLVPGRVTTITATTSPAPLTPASFSWTRNGTAVTGATASTLPIDIDKIGTYRATVTDINGCVATSANLVIGTEASDRLWIYPNPTDGVFQVRLYYPTDVATRRDVSIWNMNGQMVAKQSYDFVRGMSPYYQMNFDLTKMAPGTYLVKVTEKATDRIVSGLVIIQ